MLEYCVIKKKKNKINDWDEYYIGLRDRKSGINTYYTDYERLLFDTKKLVFEDSDNRGAAYSLVRFLNWNAYWAPYRFRKAFIERGMEAITFEGAQCYLNEFTAGTIKGMRGKVDPATQVIERARVSLFLENIKRIYHAPDLERHWIREKVYGYEKANFEYELNIILNLVKFNDQLERWLPQEIFELLVDAARENDSFMVLPLLIHRYVGMRQSELCNMRRKDSPLGQGYWFKTVLRDHRSKNYKEEMEEERSENERDDIITMEIDLRHEYRLRSDGVSVGKIKVPRITKIEACIIDDHPEILEALEQHLEWLKACPVEEEYMPLFIEKTPTNGKYMAMTSKDYKDRMGILLTKYVYKYIDNSKNEKLKAWKLRMKNKHWGPHWLRYSHSISLVLDYGYSGADLQKARGDKRLDSSWTYVSKAPQLGEALVQSNYQMINEIIQTCEKMNEFL